MLANCCFRYTILLKQSVVDKLLEICNDNSSDNDPTNDEHYIFYVKMKGDYYRYLSEVNQGTERESKQDLAMSYRHMYKRRSPSFYDFHTFYHERFQA